MKKIFKASLTILLLLTVALLGFACASNEVDYSQIESIEVDSESIANGFLLSEFDISMVKLNIRYKPTLDATGKEVAGEEKQIDAKENMVKAEDKAKLSVAGSYNITLIYGKFTIEFTLNLYDQTTQRYTVTFLDENGNLLEDKLVVGGQSVPSRPMPNKDGYIFNGWIDKETNKPAVLSDINKNLTLIASYVPNSYKVTFISKRGDTEVEIDTVSVPRGSNAYEYAPDIPVFAGYSNGRWENTASMKNVNSEGLKFYAVYDRDQIVVTFIYKGTSDASTLFTRNTFVDTNIDNPPSAERTGYKFIGWFANGKKITFPYKITNEMTFEAEYIDLNKGNDGLEYTSINATEVQITNFDGNEDIVVIPALYDGKKVVSVAKGVFKDFDIREFVVHTDNKSLRAESGVLYNNDKTLLVAYPNLKNVSQYTVATETTDIGDYAFYKATILTEIVFNNKIVSVGDYAFSQCINLATFNAPATLQIIGESAFKMTISDSQLVAMIFPQNSELHTIKKDAFYGLVSISEINLPNSLVTLGENVFYNCVSLSAINVAQNNNFAVENGGLYSNNFATFYAYPAMFNDITVISSEFELNENTTLIKKGAFHMAKISGIKINSVVELEDYAISCPNLLYVLIVANNVIYTQNSFDTVVPNIYVHATNSALSSLQQNFGTSVKIYDSSFVGGEDFVNDFIYQKVKTMQNQTEIIEITILGWRSSNENLNIPNTISNVNVTRIAPDAFNGDNNIKTVVLPVNIVEIGERAFANAKNLESVTLNDTLIKVGDKAFYNCVNLNEIIYTEELEITGFGKDVMVNTKWIKNISEDMLNIGNVLVKYNGLGTSAVVTENISYIATDAFSQKSSLTSITFVGNNLRIIDYRAFQYCTGLASLTFPRSLNYIANEAFYGCEYLFVVNYSNIEIANDTLIVHEDAYKTSEYQQHQVYQIFSNTTLYKLTYYVDSAEQNTINGVAFIAPLAIENIGTSRFAGWFEDENKTISAKFPMALTSDKSLYAKWISSTQSTAGLQYDLNENGQYKITGYVGSDSYVIVPDSYKGKKVVEIDKEAFKDCSHVTQIELPNTLMSGKYKSSIQYVGEDAFVGTYWFDNYQGDFVIIDDILIKYKGRAELVSIPEDIGVIAKGAFKDNIDVEKIILSDIIVLLDDSVFENCINLTEIILPRTLMQINSKVFYNCYNLTDIDFSRCENLTNIGYDALENTNWLNSYIDDCVLINKTLYKYQGQATTLHILNSIVNISERAFMGNDTLIKVYIPESVKLIGQSAFEDCKINAVMLFAGNNSLENIANRAFYNCVFLTTLDLTLAHNLSYIGDSAFEKCINYKSLSVPSEVEYLGSYSFYQAGLVNINFSEGSKLTTINEYTFAENSSLKSVNFVGANNLKTIGEYAFADCILLNYFQNLGSSIEKISDGAFLNCGELKKFSIIDNKLVDIGDNALDGVGYINNDENMVVFGNILVSYKGRDAEVEIPDFITTIYNRAFYGNENLTKIEFGSSSALKSINAEAFANCTNLKDINFPASIVRVGNDVMKNTKWYNDNKDEFIMIGSTLIKYNSSVTKQVIIPQYVTVINAKAFENTSVFDITIDENVLKIADGAFDGILNGYPDWTITMLGNYPPELLEDNVILTSKILINSEDARENYRLDDGWEIQYDAGKLVVKNTYTVSFNIPEDKAEIIENQDLYAIYAEIDVNTKVDGNRAYIFVGWFLDSEYTLPLSYPYIISQNVTLYGKCIDNTEGSNAAYFTIVDHAIVRYGYYNDTKIVVISSHAEENIVATAQSYQVNSNGEYINVDGEYVYDPGATGTKYSHLGAFERHTELKEVYFASNSALETIGINTFKDCTNLQKIVIPATIKTIKSGAFANCSSLTEVIFAGDISNVVIEEGAFENCISLTTLVIPVGIKTLENGAFANCINLVNIYANAEMPISLGENMPFEIVEGLKIYILASSFAQYESAWSAYKDYLVKVND